MVPPVSAIAATVQFLDVLLGLGARRKDNS
jgi:hypothetical protein